MELDEEVEIAARLRRLAPELARKPHFLGWGVGFKWVAGRRTETGAALLYVDKKVAPSRLSTTQRLPPFIRVKGRDVPTDVCVLSAMTLLGNPAANDAKTRPLLGGLSISICPNSDDNCPDTFGTGGALVVDAAGTHYLLSAAHVMSVVAASVIQPGRHHGGHNHDKTQVGTVAIVKNGKKVQQPVYKYGPPRDNVGGVVRLAGAGIDAAIAEIIQMAPTQVGLGRGPAGAHSPAVGLPVTKSGAATGVTRGLTIADHQGFIPGGRRIITKSFVDKKLPGWKADTNMPGLFLVETGAFGDGGDSGSLILAASSTSKEADLLKKVKIPEFSAIGLLIGEVTLNGTRVIVGQDITASLKALKVSLV